MKNQRPREGMCLSSGGHTRKDCWVVGVGCGSGVREVDQAYN